MTGLPLAQGKTENRTFAGGAPHRNVLPMCLQYMLDNGQSQTGTPEIPGTAFVNPVKTFKNSGQMLRFNTYSGINDFHQNGIADVKAGDCGGTAFVTVVD